MDTKYIALIIASLCLWALVRAVSSQRKLSGLSLLSLSFMVYWGFQFFLTH